MREGQKSSGQLRDMLATRFIFSWASQTPSEATITRPPVGGTITCQGWGGQGGPGVGRGGRGAPWLSGPAAGWGGG